MKSCNRWHILKGLSQMLPLKSHGKCKRDRIQTGSFPAVCPNSGDPLVQWLKIKPAFRYKHLLDARLLCLHPSWDVREGYFPNQLFLGTSFGLQRAFEFLPNPPQGLASCYAQQLLSFKIARSTKTKLPVANQKVYILLKLSQSHNIKPQNPNPPWKLQEKLPHATNNFKDRRSVRQTLSKLQIKFSMLIAHLWAK